MKTLIPITATLALLILIVGCVQDSIVGHDRVETGVYSRNVGITGHRTTLTIQTGSKVPKLSIIGDNCNITVEDGANVGRIEFWGNGNTVSLPHDLLIYVSQAGTNTVNHRPKTQSTPAPPPQ